MCVKERAAYIVERLIVLGEAPTKSIAPLVPHSWRATENYYRRALEIIIFHYREPYGCMQTIGEKQRGPSTDEKQGIFTQQ